MSGHERSVAVALLAGLSILVPWSAVGAQEGYPPAPEQSQAVSKTVLEPGESLTVSGMGFNADSQIYVLMRAVETVVGSTTADSLGYFLVQVNIPCGTEPGSHQVVTTGQDPAGAPLELSSPVTILDAPCHPVSLETGPSTDPAAGPASSEELGAPNTDPRPRGADRQADLGEQERGGDLPRTGSSPATLPLALVAAGLIAAGWLALALTYRGRSSGTG